MPQPVLEAPPNLTADMLNRRVRKLPGLSDASCLPGWTGNRIGKSVGNGTVGIFRISGEAVGSAGQRPWSLVCKVLEEGTKDNRFNTPAIELSAYESKLFDKPLGYRGFRAARCYGVDLQDDGIRFLWLEDLSACPAPPWPDDTYISVARHVGQFNGEWTLRPVPPYPWIDRERWKHGGLTKGDRGWDRVASLRDPPFTGFLA